MNLTYPASDHAGGLTCPECERKILPGQPYATQLDSVIDGTPVLLCVCVYCVGPEATR